VVILAIWIEHSLNVAVQGPHDADPREHGRPAGRRAQDQGFHPGVPLRCLMLGLRELRDVPASCSVTSWRPRGNGIGSSSDVASRDQPPADRSALSSAARFTPGRYLGGIYPLSGCSMISYAFSRAASSDKGEHGP